MTDTDLWATAREYDEQWPADTSNETVLMARLALKVRGGHSGGRFWSQAEWSEWSNTLARLVPEEYHDDVAQEAIIERALSDLAAARAEVADLRDRLARVKVLAEPNDPRDDNSYLPYAVGIEDDDGEVEVHLSVLVDDLRRALGDADTLAEGCGAAWLQPEPPEHVLAVTDYTADAAPIDDSPQWGRTTNGEWKGYKDGGKEYLDWPELCRRWGPLTWDEGATDE